MAPPNAQEIEYQVRTFRSHSLLFGTKTGATRHVAGARESVQADSELDVARTYPPGPVPGYCRFPCHWYCHCVFRSAWEVCL